MPRRDHIQISDAALAARLDELRRPGESRGQCAGRLLRAYLALLDTTTADLVAALDEIRATADRALPTTP